MPHDFPCMDDAPTNNGYGNKKDWDEIRPQHFIDNEDWYGEEDELFPREKENTVTIINKNDGAMNCQNE